MATFDGTKKVRLNSGGPDMTVEKTVEHPRDGREMVICSWVTDDGLFEARAFPAACVNAPKGSG